MRIAKTKVVMILAALLITMGLCLAEDDVFIKSSETVLFDFFCQKWESFRTVPVDFWRDAA
ncbi:MAG: hypothetical protein IJI71_02935 [Clostridia bacterium]|nr:hypothetical protein [Clostridia bacterium]